MNVLKLLTFYRSGPFDMKAEFADEKTLLPLTSKELGTFKIDLPAQPEPKKVKVKAKLTLHGIFNVESAQLVEEEEYEETVKEKRELPPDPEEPSEAEGEADKKEGDSPPMATEDEQPATENKEAEQDA